MGPPLIASSTLVLRETLLGALKARLENDRLLMIHASDFHTAVEQLGLSFGSRDVDDIMVLCKIGEDGYIDFTGFDQHCKDARSLAKTAITKKPKRGQSSSSSTPIQPLRPSDAHNMMAEAEKQTKIVRVQEKRIKSFFEDFDDGTDSTAAFRSNLESLGLKITTDLDALLRRSECCDTPFGEVMRTLCVPDHGAAPFDAFGIQQSGGKARPRAQVNNEFGIARKRTAPHRATSLLAESTADSERRQIGARGSGGRKGKFFSDSSQIAGTLNQGADKTLHSTSKMQMLEGLGEAHTAATGVNCEQKMLKQQIFSLVRKMDAGEISATIFQDKLFTMGFEIPVTVLQLLKNYDSSGKVNFKEFIRAFERYFDSRAGESTATPEKLKGIKAELKRALLVQGASSVANLAKTFREMDEDGSKNLSLSEFKKGILGFGLDLDPNDVRLLFNSFDKNGDGQLSYMEFMGVVRGELPPQRLRLIRQAFQVLDKTGTQTIDLEDVKMIYDPSRHPDVQSGSMSPDECLMQFLDTFDSHDHDGHVTFDEFLDYYSNISASVDDDGAFDGMLRTEWNLDEMPPPPPSFSRGRNGNLVAKPVAGQTHGDILNWNQQPSKLEQRAAGATRSGHRHYSAVDAHGANKINVTNWSGCLEDGAQALDEEFGSLVGHKTRSNRAHEKNISVTSWERHERSKAPPRRKKFLDEEVWSPSGKSKAGANNKALYGRPSPFGTDDAGASAPAS
ncbi:hypothetical protein TrRE_jg1605, partial [Triparma retinervis]